MFQNFKNLTLAIIFLITLFMVTAKQKDFPNNEIICKSTTIRSVKDFNQLQNCTIVIGSIRILHMHFTSDLLEQIEPSNIEEINDYLLVYRVEGLDSLDRLFPKLIVIRGVQLLYDQYALIVIENRDLQNIGLISLLRVLKGSIRVESNPSLCFTHTINWVSILGNDTKKYYYVLKNNKIPGECPLCYTYQDEIESKNLDRHKRCWSQGKFQRYTSDYYAAKKCNKQGKLSSNCLTSCYDSNCRHCKNFVSDKGCTNICSLPKYKLAYKRQCVPDCTQYNLIAFGLKCIEKCPKHYQEVIQNGTVSCVLNCTGNFKVNTIDDLEGFSYCSTIKGSLTLELLETNKPIIANLEQAFSNLNEITGFLKILRSPQLVSLNFFKNLHTIKGLDLIENTYSFYVVDNHHLEEIWNKNQQVAILNGRIYFHLNPRLCYNKILDLQKNLKETTNISITEASRTSNGERIVCDTDVRELTANVTDVNSNSVLIVHELLDQEELHVLIGYVYYYKEAPQKNATKYDGRHGCGLDGWFMDITQSKQRRHILKDLKPATQYAYFVKTMTLIDYHYQLEAISDIQYFRTLPSKPGVVAKLYSHSLSTSEIEIFWWPPRLPNGIIEKYLLHYEETNITDLTTSNINTQTKNDQCLCPKLENQNSATPYEENYYKKEEVIYTDSLMNFILKKNDSKTNNNNNNSIKINTSNAIKEQTLNSNTTFDDILTKINDIYQEGARKIQDLDKDNFFLVHPKSICNQTYPSTIQYQSENRCTSLEMYDDVIKIPAQQHSYTLTNLKPGITYRISLRACVANLINGCGPEKVLLAETVTKSLETFIKTLQLHKL